MAGAHWWPAYVGIGSNLDSPQRQVKAAVTAMGNLPKTVLIAISAHYQSAPLGPVEQADFVNAVAGLLTQFSARDLFAELQDIEREQGRERDGERWGPRTIDLDLLAYGAEKIDDNGLTIPHPGIGERNFVLLPWREIAPNYNVPGLGEVARLAAGISTSEPRIRRIG